MALQASRFIFVSDFFQDGVVDKEAFMPPPRPVPHETSVITHGNNGPEWQTGVRIGLKRKRPIVLVGSAEFSDTDAHYANLCVEPSPTTVSRNHANLKGWHASDKLVRLLQAEVIASRSIFIVAPKS